MPGRGASEMGWKSKPITISKNVLLFFVCVFLVQKTKQATKQAYKQAWESNEYEGVWGFLPCFATRGIFKLFGLCGS
jgi:hypothetical protein